MADKWLHEINDISDVTGSLLCSNHGGIIEDNCDFIEKDAKENIVLNVIRIMAAFNMKKMMLREVELIWTNYHIIAKNAPDFIIITFWQESSKPILSFDFTYFISREFLHIRIKINYFSFPFFFGL